MAKTKKDGGTRRPRGRPARYDDAWQKAFPPGSEAEARHNEFLRQLTPTVRYFVEGRVKDPTAADDIAAAILANVSNQCARKPGFQELLTSDSRKRAQVIGNLQKKREMDYYRRVGIFAKRSVPLPEERLGNVEEDFAYPGPERTRSLDAELEQNRTSQQGFDPVNEVTSPEWQPVVHALFGSSQLVADGETDDKLTRDERENWLAIAEAQLTEKQRKAWRLKYIEGKKNVEIARDMGIAPPTVSELISRAKAVMHEVLVDVLGPNGADSATVTRIAQATKTDPAIALFRVEKARSLGRRLRMDPSAEQRKKEGES